MNQESISVGVSTPAKPDNNYCRMFVGDSGMGTIRAGWTQAVKYCDLKEGDVCMLSFMLPNILMDDLEALHMVIVKLEPEDDDDEKQKIVIRGLFVTNQTD